MLPPPSFACPIVAADWLRFTDKTAIAHLFRIDGREPDDARPRPSIQGYAVRVIRASLP